MNQKKFNVRFIVEAGVIAALYAVITIINPFSSGQFQVRLSEALTILPMFTPAAIPGLFVGCIIGNSQTPGNFGIFDIFLGSLVTLSAAFLSSKIKNRFLVPLPPVLLNAVYVGLLLQYYLKLPFLITVLTVAAGEIIACYGLGLPLILLLEKHRSVIFRK